MDATAAAASPRLIKSAIKRAGPIVVQVLHAQSKPPGYLLAEVAVTVDEAAYKDSEFMKQTVPTIKAAGAKYLAGGFNNATALSGAAPANRIALYSEVVFRHEAPFDRSSLTRWRQRLGEEPARTEGLLIARPRGGVHRPRQGTVPYEFGWCRLPPQPPRPKADSSCCMPRRCIAIRTTATRSVPSSSLISKSSQVLLFRRIHGDKGYRDHNYPDRFRVWISGQVRRVTKVIRREMRRRAVEPVIGHLKDDHRMRRSYLKGRDGDRINAVLAAAGYNFSLLLRWFEKLLRVLLLIICRSRWPRLLLG